MKIDRLQTFGFSMYPLCRDRDVVFFKKTGFNRLKVNDIVVFQSGRKYVTHRLVYKNSNYVITKGDNNPYPDPKTHPAQIIGRLDYINRGATKIDPEVLYLVQS